MNRRSFLAGSAALAAGQAFGAVPASGAVDVVIVGAGAAGIAAARRLSAAGMRFALLEASGRIGGRCITDTRRFGVPFDRGAHWIYKDEANPVVQLAANTGFELYKAPPNEWLRIGERDAREDEMEKFNAATQRANSAIDEAARGETDLACAQALPKDLGEFRSTIEFALGPYDCGKDLSEVSAFDFVRNEEPGNDLFCRQGYGALLAKVAHGIPVQLSTPVTQIDYSSRGSVLVQTAKGTLRAQSVIVTASTGVLAADKLKFNPALPVRHREALAKLQLGAYEHIALELAGNPLDLESDYLVYEKATGNRTAALLANISGTPLCYVNVGGRFGRELAAQGEAAMIDFAVDWLADLYGSKIKATIMRTQATRWGQEPWVLGSYSCAGPGNQPARGMLAEPLNNCVWFAGEAVHETCWGSVNGAWQSGEAAANGVIGRLEMN